MYKAGIAGYFAPRAVFPSLGRPRVLRILADTDLKYSCSGMCKAGFSGVSAPRAVLPEAYRKIGSCVRWRLFFSGPLYLVVTCSSCLPEEYRFAYFREMTSGMFPVFSALLGSTADTCSASV